jgi:serine/threonine-protein kinase
MSNTWKQWEGQTVNGKFPLLRLLGESGQGAVFLTERHEGERLVKAAIKLIPVSSENGELQLSRWQQAAKLSHPHLIPLHEMGRFDLGGEPCVYVVMECAEENLAQVLPDRALTAAEVREMLVSVLDVLTYLHGQGFVHGHIKPGNIMASGEELKMSSDGLRRAGESLEGQDYLDAYSAPENGRGVLPMSQPLSAAGDVWSLGMTLIETLTQKLPVPRTAEQQDPVLPESLQEPFRDIADHCLRRHPESRWTLTQIAARLEGRASMPQARSIPSAPRLPEPAARPIAQRPSPRPKRDSSYAPAVVGIALILAAILVGSTLLRRKAAAPQVPTAAEVRPPVSRAAGTLTQPTQERADKSSKPNIAHEERTTKPLVPVPASIHPEPMREEKPIGPNLPRGSMVRGEVAHQVLPEVLQSARNSIRGTVKVRVKVNVDRSGNVEDAELESRGPSKYFARQALDAAQLWEFKPPKVGGRGVLSTWIIHFEFTRDGTKAVPTQEMP